MYTLHGISSCSTTQKVLSSVPKSVSPSCCSFSFFKCFSTVARCLSGPQPGGHRRSIRRRGRQNSRRVNTVQAATQQLRKCLWKSFEFESFTLAAAGGALSATSAASFRILSLQLAALAS